MTHKMLFASLVFSAAAFAGNPINLANLDRAPTFQPGAALACPQGTRQVTTRVSSVTCQKTTAAGAVVNHGPMISFYGNGKVEAVGQVDNGMRTGTWQFFDLNGNKVGETEFQAGVYHGRVTKLVEGKLVFEQNWVKGVQQGVQKNYDANGVVTVSEYRDGVKLR